VSGGQRESCQVVIHDGGTYGEETLNCDLPVHAGREHHDPRRSLWWDEKTKVRVPAWRHRKLECDRENLLKAASGKPVSGYLPLERWFLRLPNRSMEDKCGCGSGKPVVYWSPEDGSSCEDCRHSLSVYIPAAVMWNILDHFQVQLPDEERARLAAVTDDPRRTGR